GGIVDDVDGAAERGREVESDPPGAEVNRVDQRPAVEDRSRVADRNGLVVPPGSGLHDPSHHLLGRQIWPGGEFARRILAGDQELDASPPNVDAKDVHGVLQRAQPAFLMASLLDAITSSSSFQDLTNDLAPSSWSRAARARTSMPAWAKRASTFSQSP